jgi:hypothetical protein
MMSMSVRAHAESSSSYCTITLIIVAMRERHAAPKKQNVFRVDECGCPLSCEICYSSWILLEVIRLKSCSKPIDILSTGSIHAQLNTDHAQSEWESSTLHILFDIIWFYFNQSGCFFSLDSCYSFSSSPPTEKSRCFSFSAGTYETTQQQITNGVKERMCLEQNIKHPLTRRYSIQKVKHFFR